MSAVAIMEPASTGLALIGNIKLPVSFIKAEVTDVLAQIKASVAAGAEGLDISTEKGRSGLKSLAYKIAQTKTAWDDQGKELVADIKAKSNLIDAERRRIRDELDDLKAEVRKPLTDWEEAEKERVRLHECTLLEIQEVRKSGSVLGLAPAAIAEAIEALAPYKARDWQEFSKRAETALSIAAEDLEFRHKAAVKSEAEAAELAKLRAEAEERRKVEREKEIAAAAIAAAQEAAAEVLRKEREAATAREAEIERQRKQAEIDRIAAENRERLAAETAEAERVRYHEFCLSHVSGMISDACSPFNGADKIRYITEIFDRMEEHKRDWQEFAGRYADLVTEGRKRIADRLAEVGKNEAAAAERRKQEAAEQLARDRAESEAQAKRNEEAAIEAERQRVAKIATDEAKARQQREQNRAHRAKINRAALAALVVEGIPEEWAKAAIEAIAQAKVPAISISY